MELTVQRESESSEWTQGKFYINNVFECFVLEDQKQEKKIMHETRIPAGRYEIKLRTFGGHHETFAKKFPDLHKGMLWLQNVPGFQDILIHTGNTDDDSSGCLLVGKSFKNGVIVAGTSTSAYLSLYKKILTVLEKKEKVFITIKDIK